MSQVVEPEVPPGWVGGFADSDPAFAYPDPDLSSLPLLDNLDTIDRLQRQQAVLWPEFSWETVPGEPTSRCFQMFAPDISRIGYTDEGRVFSIICPQQGACSSVLGCLNVEVSVTGQRGWVDEPARTLAADMEVEGKIWFSPSARANPLVKLLDHALAGSDLPFPLTKERAIRVQTHHAGAPEEPVFPVRTGPTDRFESPAFAQHPEAYAVGNVEVEIGPVRSTGHEVVDDLNQLVLDVFNMASGNMLRCGNVLTWNVHFATPQLVDQQEWRDHAKKWRDSIDADHGSPDGPGTAPRYADGRTFRPEDALVQEELDAVLSFLAKHLPHLRDTSAASSA